MGSQLGICPYAAAGVAAGRVASTTAAIATQATATIAASVLGEPGIRRRLPSRLATRREMSAARRDMSACRLSGDPPGR